MEFVGSVVSLSCGGILGTYQGKVSRIDNVAQTVTIEQAFHNGKKCQVPSVTINAADICDLKILIIPERAKELPEVRLQPLSVTTSIDTTPTKPAPLNGLAKTSYKPLTKSSGKSCVVNSDAGSLHKAAQSVRERGQSPLISKSPSSLSGTPVKQCQDTNGYTNGSGHPFWTDDRSQHSSPGGEHVLPRKNSFNDIQMVSTSKRGFSTPWKQDSRRRLTREDCFSEPVDNFISQDFDFEKNLAMFDKIAVFEEIESLGYPKIVRNNGNMEEKYRNDENILPSNPAMFDQISIPGGPSKQYVTDSGLIVPSVSYETRSKLLEAAYGVGYSLERQVETVGRSASEMVLQLIGGIHRLVPQNAHQKPSVVVLCGPHIQGAQGVNCARHLATRNVHVTLFMPNFVKVLHELERELQLFDLCDGLRTANIKDLPSLPVDMIVNAMDNHDNKCLREQAWYQKVVSWANLNKASVLAIDPPVEGAAIDMKWSLSLALPLPLSERCGQVYLCDLSLPNILFQNIGITYASPFAHKFVIPLHSS